MMSFGQLKGAAGAGAGADFQAAIRGVAASFAEMASELRAIRESLLRVERIINGQTPAAGLPPAGVIPIMANGADSGGGDAAR